MPKKPKAATAPSIQIIADCERDAEGFGALPFVQCNRSIMVATRPQISALKAQLLEAGFESNEASLLEYLATGPTGEAELRADWENDEVPRWDPRAGMFSDGWTIVAVLEIPQEGEFPADAVAVFARPAGMVETAQPRQDWPFPEGKPGESGPDVVSTPKAAEEPPPEDAAAWAAPAPAPAPAPAAAPRPGVFELLEWTEATVATVTNRVEKHGDEDKPAVSLGLAITTENFILDRIDPKLRHALYKAKDEAHTELPDVQLATPVLRCNSIERTVLPTKHEGWTLAIDCGADEDEAMQFGGCKLSKFSVEPKQGGTVVLRFSVGTSDIDAERLGYLGMHHGESIWIMLHAPRPKAEAIDGTQAAYERDHPPTQPGPNDLFLQAHGGDDSEAASDADKDAAAHGGDEPDETEGGQAEEAAEEGVES